MATPAEIEAALAALRAARAALFQASTARKVAVSRRVRVATDFATLNLNIANARASVASANQTLRDLLAEGP